MTVDLKQGLGVVCSAAGTVVAQTTMNEVLYTISLILTILGTIWTFIVWPLIQWYNKSKKDGKIDSNEIKEGLDIINTGIQETIERIDENNKKQ